MRKANGKSKWKKLVEKASMNALQILGILWLLNDLKQVTGYTRTSSRLFDSHVADVVHACDSVTLAESQALAESHVGAQCLLNCTCIRETLAESYKGTRRLLNHKHLLNLMWAHSVCWIARASARRLLNRPRVRDARWITLMPCSLNCTLVPAGGACWIARTRGNKNILLHSKCQ